MDTGRRTYGRLNRQRLRPWPAAALLFAALAAAKATTYYVDASRPDNSGDGLSWATAKRTISAAATLAASGDGHEVVVTNGVYYVADGTAGLSRRYTVIRSVNGPEYTIVQGTGSGSDNIAFQFSGDSCSNCIVRGFTVLNVRKTSWPPGAIVVQDGWAADHMVLECRVEDCVVVNCGSYAIGCADIAQGSNLILSNCKVRDSGGVYLQYLNGPAGKIYNCEFIRTGGVSGYNYASNALFHSCRSGSYGGASYLYGSNLWSGEMHYCRFIGNATPTNVGSAGACRIDMGGSGRWLLRNCLFAGNECPAGGWWVGGALSLQSGTAILENCTLTANSAPNRVNLTYGGYGGAIALNGAALYMVNTICISNVCCPSAPGLYSHPDIAAGAAPPYPVWMTNCCCGFVCNPPERGANNIAANPCFYDWGAGFGTNNIGTDFRIRRVSPCVNAGLDQPWMSGAPDLAGNRRQCGTVDMGAYEYRLPQGTMLIFRGN